MSNTKHTPGPWTFYPKYEGEHAVAIVKDMFLIAEVNGSAHNQGQLSKETAVANAKLIAAAPALLEALNDLLTELAPSYNFDEKNAPEVVKKAIVARKQATE